MYIIGVSIIFLGVMFYYGADLSNELISLEAFAAKFSEEQRSDLYPQAFRLFLENFYVGIGESRLVHILGMWPHNNILALGGSFGFFSVMIYLVFMGVTLYACGVLGREAKNVSFLSSASITIGAFLMLKGFVHDTWFDPMVWFAVGVSSALLALPQSRGHAT
jgi:hypothetical protein